MSSSEKIYMKENENTSEDESSSEDEDMWVPLDLETDKDIFKQTCSNKDGNSEHDTESFPEANTSLSKTNIDCDNDKHTSKDKVASEAIQSAIANKNGDLVNVEDNLDESDSDSSDDEIWIVDEDEMSSRTSAVIGHIDPANNDAPLSFNANKDKPPMPIERTSPVIRPIDPANNDAPLAFNTNKDKPPMPIEIKTSSLIGYVDPANNDAPLAFNTNKDKPPMPIERKENLSSSRHPNRRNSRSVSRSPDRRYRRSRSSSSDSQYRRSRSRSTDRNDRKPRSRERKCSSSRNSESSPVREKRIWSGNSSNETKSNKRQRLDDIDRVQGNGFCGTDIAIMKPSSGSQKMPYGCFIGDSWILQHQLQSITVKNGTQVNIAPHFVTWNTVKGGENVVSRVDTLNLSKSGQTFKGVLDDQDLIDTWIEAAPDFTLVALGAYDFINEGLSFQQIRVDYAEYVISFLELLLEKAMNAMKVETYTEWRPKHKFLVMALPDLGQYHLPCGKIPCEEYKEIRRSANRGLSRKISKLHKVCNAIVVRPQMSNPKFIINSDLNYLYLSADYQKDFNAKIVRAIGRLYCDRCKLPSVFEWDKYKTLLWNNICDNEI